MIQSIISFLWFYLNHVFNLFGLDFIFTFLGLAIVLGIIKLFWS